MARHSKNNTAGSVFTYGERQKLKTQNEWGEITSRIGRDSQKKFEQCSLCLKMVEDPMCCCKGHIYCKCCIIENLLSQKKEIKKSKEKWEDEQKLIKQKESNKLLAIHNEKVELLKKVEDGVNEIDTHLIVENTQSDEQMEKSQHIEDIRDKRNLIPTREKNEMTKDCFWIPEKTPAVENSSENKLSEKLFCPINEKNHFIKLKELIKLNLKKSDADEKFSCWVCNKEISVQKVVALKKCGHVMCKKCLELFCSKDNICSTCNEPFSQGDVIPLMESGTGFSSHNQIDDVLEDIMDIKTVQVKGEMLFSETNGKPKDHYEVLDNIATGTLALVKKVRNKFSGCIRAMKVIKKAFIDLQEDEKNFMKEIAILRTLDHLNILKIYEFYQDEKCFYLISEYCNDGDLFDKIQKQGVFGEYSACFIIYQILSSILYCHSNFIVHRDIKAENILIESVETIIHEGNEIDMYHIRISDFSSARSFNSSKKLTKKVGTPYYIAPEVLKRNYNEKCDAWSIGVLLFILLSGKPPFWGDSDKEILLNVEKGVPDKRQEEWRHISPEAQSLCDMMLKLDPGKRISVGDAIKHPWFQKYLIKQRLSMEKYNELYRNIISFKIDPKYFFQQATIAYMVHHIAMKEDVNEIRKFYSYLDVNGDGKMAYNEIVDGIKKVTAVNEKDVLRIFKYVDQAKSGYIEYEEFVRACISKNLLLSDENLKTTFVLFNKTEDEKDIPCTEFKLILGLQSKFSEKTWDQIIKTIDVNGDNMISYDEFRDMMVKFKDDYKD